MMHNRSSSSRSLPKSFRPLVLLFVAIAFVSISQLTLLVSLFDKNNDAIKQSSSSSLLREDKLQLLSPSSSSSSLLESYDPARYPVLSRSLIKETLTTTSSSTKKIKVGIVTIDPLVGEARHFLYDGVMRSAYLELVGVVSLYNGPNNTHPTIVLKPNDAQVWLIDGARTAKLKRNFTTSLLSTTTSQNHHQDNNINLHKNQPPPPPYVVFMDYTDRFEFQVRHYNQHNVWDKSHVRLAVRSIIQGRNYGRGLPATGNNEAGGWDMGKIASNRHTAGGPMLHCPYSVRSDIVETVRSLLLLPQLDNHGTIDSKKMTTTTTKALEDAIFEEHPRPMDVLHMWKISFKEGKSKLRNAVSKLIRGINGTEIVIDDNIDVDHHQRRSTIIVQTSIDERGERHKVGRNTVDPSYVQAMLTSKIVVVTQKDDWEDHYRLFEALVCGAMVFADRMLAPPKGFVHQQNIVFFDNITHLETNIKYYLSHNEERKQIAKNGWELAMTKHRSWHRIEEILFGRILTQ